MQFCNTCNLMPPHRVFSTPISLAAASREDGETVNMMKWLKQYFLLIEAGESNIPQFCLSSIHKLVAHLNRVYVSKANQICIFKSGSLFPTNGHYIAYRAGQGWFLLHTAVFLLTARRLQAAKLSQTASLFARHPESHNTV